VGSLVDLGELGAINVELDVLGELLLVQIGVLTLEELNVLGNVLAKDAAAENLFFFNK